MKSQQDFNKGIIHTFIIHTHIYIFIYPVHILITIEAVGTLFVYKSFIWKFR